MTVASSVEVVKAVKEKFMVKFVMSLRSSWEVAVPVKLKVNCVSVSFTSVATMPAGILDTETLEVAI